MARQGKRTSFDIPEDVTKALGYAAVEKGMSKSDLVTEALRAYLPTISTLPQVGAIAA